MHTLTQTDKHTLSVLENEPPPADGANNAPCLLPAHTFFSCSRRLFAPCHMHACLCDGDEIMLALFTPSHCSGVGFRTRFTSMIQAARFTAAQFRSAPHPFPCVYTGPFAPLSLSTVVDGTPRADMPETRPAALLDRRGIAAGQTERLALSGGRASTRRCGPGSGPRSCRGSSGRTPAPPARRRWAPRCRRPGWRRGRPRRRTRRGAGPRR